MGGLLKMPKKKSGWNNTCNRFVAFLDIMGFKEMVFRNSPNKLYETLKSFRNAIYDIEKSARTSVKMASAGRIIEKTTVKVIIFSDSIILVSNDDSAESANDILFSVSAILFKAAQQCIPMKGAIAYGNQTAAFKHSLHFGQPLIDAYELHNELLLYGAVLHNTMEKRLIELGMIEKCKGADIFEYPVPMKSGEIKHYLVSWDWFDGKKEAVETVLAFYNKVSGNPRKYVDNTLDFISWQLDVKV